MFGWERTGSTDGAGAMVKGLAAAAAPAPTAIMLRGDSINGSGACAAVAKQARTHCSARFVSTRPQTHPDPHTHSSAPRAPAHRLELAF